MSSKEAPWRHGDAGPLVAEGAQRGYRNDRMVFYRLPAMELEFRYHLDIGVAGATGASLQTQRQTQTQQHEIDPAAYDPSSPPSGSVHASYQHCRVSRLLCCCLCHSQTIPPRAFYSALLLQSDEGTNERTKERRSTMHTYAFAHWATSPACHTEREEEEEEQEEGGAGREHTLSTSTVPVVTKKSICIRREVGERRGRSARTPDVSGGERTGQDRTGQ